MRYLSLFSGIGGADLGLDRSGMECVGQVEQDKTCLNVLAKHWPNVKRIDDVRNVTATTFAVRPDLIVGGFPCQDLSVAGRRDGIAGERSGLFWELHRIIQTLLPRWFLIENVPGLLSSQEGRDFGLVIASLAELGYGVAWRVLDARYFGLAQRRKRVFIVGSLGTLRCGEVLFEPESVCGHSPPSRKERENVAGTIAGSVRGSGKFDHAGDESKQLEFVAGTLSSHSKRHGHAMSTGQAAESGQIVVASSGSGSVHGGDDPGRHPEERLIAFDERNITSQANRSNPQPGDPCHTLHSSPPTLATLGVQGHRDTLNAKGGKRYDGESETFVACTLSSSDGGVSSGMHPVVEAYQCHGSNVGPMGTLSAEGSDASEDGTGRGTPLVAATLRNRQHSPGTSMPGRGGKDDQNLVFAWNKSSSQTVRVDQVTTPPLQASPTSNPGLANMSGVRRLTPRECERLMGLPNDFTRWGSDGKEISDSARYKMIGNSIAVPCSEWIGRRIISLSASADVQEDKPHRSDK